jgi:hypothetical protein
MSSNPIAEPTSPTYTWADEALAKHQADRSKFNGATTDFITSANNPSEITTINDGNQRGRMNIQAFDDAWKSRKWWERLRKKELRSLQR